MSILNNSIIAGASANQNKTYNIDRSLRFRSSAPAYLTRTPGSAGNRQKWTYSAWVKRGLLGSANQKMLCVFNGNNDNQLFEISFQNDKIYLEGYTVYWRITTAVYRDPSAWYHIVVSVDTTQATASDRVKLYVNGVQVTAFDTTNNPVQNSDTAINQAAAHYIGIRNGSGGAFDGYMTDVYLIDGQALTSSSFGESDTVSGVWKPKRYTGSYGTNGFKLDFSDNSAATAAAIGKDSSGNGNNWTPNNISVTAGATYDSMTDVPTLTSATAANYAVFSPIDSLANISNGNLKADGSSSGDACSSISFLNGKFYAEVKVLALGTNIHMGFTWASKNGKSHSEVDSKRMVYHSLSGGFYSENTGLTSPVTGLPTYGAGDTIGLALDLPAGTVSFYKNGSLAYTTTSASIIGGQEWKLIVYTQASNDSVAVNFGQQPWAYTPPSGFKALNTFNLPTPAIPAGNKVMDATPYAGNSTARSITNAGGFKPDFVWVKDRTSGTPYHQLSDSVRGATKQLFSNGTDAEDTNTSKLTSFDTAGFSLGNSGAVNASGDNYVAWQWQAGQGSTSTNTSGSTTSTVSVNPSAGFSIVSWTGNSANATIGHGLGVAPSFYIVKFRDSTTDWPVYHASIPSAVSNPVILNGTNGLINISNYWYQAPTSTTFGVGPSANGTGKSIAYCWSEVAGFSKFGSYTGNGSADGPFVYTGFRPKYVMIKRVSAAESWIVKDSSRAPYNTKNNGNLFPNNSNAEDTYEHTVDFLSNGFKVRTTDYTAVINGSGDTYVYACFAENPLKYSLAR